MEAIVHQDKLKRLQGTFNTFQNDVFNDEIDENRVYLFRNAISNSNSGLSDGIDWNDTDEVTMSLAFGHKLKPSIDNRLAASSALSIHGDPDSGRAVGTIVDESLHYTSIADNQVFDFMDARVTETQAYDESRGGEEATDGTHSSVLKSHFKNFFISTTDGDLTI